MMKVLLGDLIGCGGIVRVIIGVLIGALISYTGSNKRCNRGSNGVVLGVLQELYYGFYWVCFFQDRDYNRASSIFLAYFTDFWHESCICPIRGKNIGARLGNHA